ncbi:MAG: hypothetical protein FJZ96_06905 [Chloroflexi bacterium]|nr:hypothetical protein [Chloroflexota bacterium]
MQVGFDSTGIIYRWLAAVVSCLAISLFIQGQPVLAQQSPPHVTYPEPGQALQGTVMITGSSEMAGFISAEVSFAYPADPTDTWFTVSSHAAPVAGGTLAAWDTSQITDGEYVLRLRVFLADGTMVDYLVTGLLVRNYTPIDTPTPSPIPPHPTERPTSTPTGAPAPTPTLLPGNPAQLTAADTSTGFLIGVFAGLLVLAAVFLYSRFRRA